MARYKKYHIPFLQRSKSRRSKKSFISRQSGFLFALTLGVILAVGGSVWATSIGSNVDVSGTLTVGSSSATSTVSTGGLNVGSGQLIVQQTSGSTGIGTTTPVGLFSIEHNSLPTIFIVGDTGTSSPSFIITGTSTVGVATSSPAQTFSVGGSIFLGASHVGGNFGGLGIGKATTTLGAFEMIGNALFGDAAGDLVNFNAANLNFNNVGTSTLPINAAAWAYATSTNNAAAFFRLDTTNTRVGIASSTPGSTLGITGNVQLSGGLGVGKATTTPGVLETASSTVLQGDLTIYKSQGPSSGTSTLRMQTSGTNKVPCIEFTSALGTFYVVATSSGPLSALSGTCN